MSAIQLSQIYIYPVKSLPGIPVSQATLTPRGLKNDRRWMLVNEKGIFITQRLYPQLALLNVLLSERHIHITLPDGRLIKLSQSPDSGNDIKVKVWNDYIIAKTTDTLSNQIISDYLDVRCQFVFMPDTTIRPVDPDFSCSSSDYVSFADGFPLLLISESSLQDLNDKLKVKNIPSVPMIRFRPNIVVKGCNAFAEDRWQKFMVGDNTLLGVKPCSRCVMTTVNPKTGQKGKEPLATLLEYRKKENKAYFGQNVLTDFKQSASLALSIGDPVEIIQSGA